MPGIRALGVSIAIAALLLAGCGDDGGEGAADSGTEESTTPGDEAGEGEADSSEGEADSGTEE